MHRPVFLRSTFRRPTRTLAVLVVLAASVLSLACSSTPPTQVRGESSLTSSESELGKVGVDDAKTYGWNHLVGSTSTELGAFEVDMLGNVDYVNGTGPFFGFVTLVAPDGDRIAMRMDGDAKVRDDGTTALSSRLTVIDGSGDYVGVTGHGSFVWTRIAQVGAPIEIEFTVRLD